MNHTKKAVMMGMLILVVGMLSVSAHASIGDLIDRGIDRVADGFGSAQDATTGITIYDNNKNLIDFFVMFILFFSIAYLGLSKFTGGQGGNAGKGVAFAVGVALSIAAIKAGISPAFFIPFVKNALFFIIFFVLFLLLKQMLGEGQTIAAFVVALVITWVAFSVTDIVLDEDQKFSITSLFKVPTATKMDRLTVQRSASVRDVDVIALRHDMNRSTLPANFDDRVDTIKAKIMKELGELDSQDKSYKAKSEALMADLRSLDNLKLDYLNTDNELEGIRLEVAPTVPSGVQLIGTFGPGEPITCSTAGSTAAESIGQVVYQFDWYKDGSVAFSDTVGLSKTSQLPHGRTLAGEEWFCRVTPIVRGVSGRSGDSRHVTIEISPASIRNNDAKGVYDHAVGVLGDPNSNGAAVGAARENLERLLPQVQAEPSAYPDLDQRKIQGWITEADRQYSSNTLEVFITPEAREVPFSGGPVRVPVAYTIRGGHQPYTAQWSGVSPQTSDTIMRNSGNTVFEFSVAGTYTATLTITDSNGWQASRQVTIGVASPEQIQRSQQRRSSGGSTIDGLMQELRELFR